MSYVASLVGEPFYLFKCWRLLRFSKKEHCTHDSALLVRITGKDNVLAGLHNDKLACIKQDRMDPSIQCTLRHISKIWMNLYSSWWDKKATSFLPASDTSIFSNPIVSINVKNHFSSPLPAYIFAPIYSWDTVRVADVSCTTFYYSPNIVVAVLLSFGIKNISLLHSV